MDDLGQRSSYLVVGKGVPVYSSDGEQVGHVVNVRTDAKDDIFDGIVFSARVGPGGNLFVDAPEVGEIYERGVILKIDAAEAARLGKPGENPGALNVSPDDVAGERPPGALRRFWNLLTGRG
ncbi:MAG: hypothetical protein U0R71_00275 [Solirubrobacterales bacterium]